MGSSRKRTSRQRRVSRPRRKSRWAAPKRFALWLYYRANRGLDVDTALAPWKQWGASTGSGSDFTVSDISWDFRSFATAHEKLDRMHRALAKARVPHEIQIVDTAEDPRGRVVAKVGSLKRRRSR